MKNNKFELTNPQKSIWLTNQMYPDMPIENICGSVFIEETVDFIALENAINLFVQKNDSFRIKLINDEEGVKQYISDFEPFKIEKISLNTKDEISKIEKELVSKVFPTIETLFFKFKMFELPNGQGGFTINAHHIISDAWTAGLVVNEIMEYYEKILNNETIIVESNPSYIEYINSEKEYLHSKKFENDKIFWNETFKNVPEVASIPSINQKKSEEIDCSSKRKSFTISKELMDSINDFCKSNKASAFNFFMSVIAIYISRVSGLDEFVIGTPILNRGNVKEKQTTGMYISTIPFKINLNNEESFEDLISKISTDFLKIFRHQKYSYQYLLNDLREKDNNIPSLYKTLISYQNVRSNKQTANIKYSSWWVDNNNISDDIDIHLYDMNNTGNIIMAYDFLISKYEEGDICSIHNRVLHIINQVLQNSDIKLKDIDIITKEEKEQILNSLDKGKVSYPKNKTISQLFEEQVEKTPNNIAVKINDEEITYEELNKKANQLANYLVSKKVSINDVIAVRTDKKIEMIVAILGIIKAGACYLPINLAYPQDRVSFMVSDSNAKLLLCDNKTKDEIEVDIEKIIIDFSNELIYKGNNSNLKVDLKPDDLLYIIYTSGSTGTPKGAMITNRNVVRLMKNDEYLFDFSDKDVWTMFHSVAFDFSVWEMYGALLYGGKLVLVPDEIAKDPKLFLNLLRKEKVTVLNQTPTYFYNLLNAEMQFIDKDLKIRYIVYGGEALKPCAIQKWKEKYPKTKLINMYGITETTVHVTFKELTLDDLKLNNSNIGKPIPTLKVLLLDKNLKLVPIGVPGEICVAGDGVFKGYLNREDLNKTKLIPNPYNTSEILYRSADSAFLNKNFELEYVGRIDTQVKIRGFRVELGEIEERILEIPNIKSCIVTTKSVDNAHDLLCAYYVKNGDITNSALRNILKEKLPNYMIPQYFIELDKLPCNHNGKIDKKSLPNPIVSTEKNIVLPRNNIDERLINLFKELLNVTAISIEDSFFELGGDSLTAINLCEKIYNEFKVQIYVKDIFKNPVIMSLSDLISSQNETIVSTKIEKSPKLEYYPVSSEQKRIYYSVKKMSNENLIYNVSGGILVKSLLDIDKVKNICLKLIELQPSFRTRFSIEENQLVQQVLDFEDIKNDIKINISSGSEKNLNEIINKFPRPFDLSKAPLLRFDVCVLDEEKTLILLDTHHIIMDGVSLNILLRDFCKLYNNKEVKELEFNYIDYSVWENNYINSDQIKEYDKYWSEVFPNTDIPSLNLPYDYPSTSMNKYNGDRISYNMQKEMFNKLQDLAKIYNISEYTLFITALYIVLYKYTSQTDLIVVSPLANRNLSEFNDVIGMFVNNVVLRKNINVSKTISELLKDVQDTVNLALSNQPYPYELISKKVNNNPSLLDVVLTYQNIKRDTEKIQNSDLELISANTKTAKFNIWMEIIPENYTFNIEYNSDLFKKETIESFINHYIFILEQFISNTNLKVEEIEIITKDELKLLEKFNDTKGPINNDTVVSIFEEQVKTHPKDIALICEDKTLTYQELNKKANSLAHYLIKKGVGKNDIVCIMTNRSFETVVCMMGILKAGAAFFNVDPTYPIERTQYYLEDSKTRYVLTQKELKSRVETIENCIEIDLDNNNIYGKNFANPNVKVDMQDLSYLIYTSGSTGKPKGTMLNQVGFANMVKAMTKVLDYLKEGNKHCIASVTSTPFDIFVYEIIVSLTHGLKIAMANNAEHRNPKLLDALIRKCNVDVMTVTPSLMKINYDNREPDTALAQVKNMVFGGEPLPEKFVKDLKALADDITIYNIYGPSEITVLSNVQNLDGETEITTGPPIMNTQIHILDKNRKRVPIGVVGEIYISGIQVGLGYIGKPELTAEKFLDNPYGSGKMYKSGDIGRWTFDGKVQCLGRIDNQIKLRGLRIELGEIENLMLNIEGVTSAIVNKIEIDNKEFLCGYYVCDGDIKENVIKDVLRKALPPYMVPTYIVKLKEMPYTINRKIDRKALPMPEQNKPIVNSKVNIEELTSDEEKLLQIWKNILKQEDIDINDNFFDIGGDSVSAISMQIEAVKYGLDFEYSDIFVHPTIKELSKKANRTSEEYIKNYDYSKFKDILSRNNINNLKSIKKAKVNNILLIGATGYLGAHIINSFMKNNKGDVYCLVRPKNSIDVEKRLADTLTFYFGDNYKNKFVKRVHVVQGDITEDNLGLSSEDYDMLCNNVDVIINSGALVKHFGIKKKFEEINVLGTKNVIDFCIRNNKKLLHVSTISISGNGEKEETIIETSENINNKKIFKETDIYIGQNIKGVYSTTKFKAEILVLEAIANGLDAKILRLGNISNRYSDGVFQMNASENAFAKRIKSFVEIGAFPRYLLQHALEMTPVDLATDAIIKILNYDSKCNVFHIYDTKLLEIKLLIKTCVKDLNIDIIPVSENMMKDILTGILADNNRKDILSGIIYDLDDNKNLTYTSNIRLNSKFTEKYLKKVGFKWKKINKKYIIKYIQYLRKIKFI